MSESLSVSDQTKELVIKGYLRELRILKRVIGIVIAQKALIVEENGGFIMSPDTKQVIEEQTASKSRHKEDLTVKVVSYNTAKRLGDAICARYKKHLIC